MNIRTALLLPILLTAITACNRDEPAIQSSEAIPAPAQPQPAPEKPEVDYPGSIDIFSRVGSGKGTPIALTSGQTVSGKHAMERSGTIVAFGARIGTYHGTADGSLELTLCVDGKCEQGTRNVVGATDNDYLVFELASPITVETGSILDYTFTRSADAGKRLALWSYPKLETQTGLIGPDGQSTDNTPRLSIHLQ